MTEAEWLSCDDPMPMLTFLQGKAGERKQRLFACACYRLLANLVAKLIGHAEVRAVEAAERAADGLATAEELAAVQAESARGYQQLVGPYDYVPPPPGVFAVGAALSATSPSAADAAEAASGGVAQAVGDRGLPAQASLLRDLFGPLPFRPVVLDPAWRAWNGGSVVKLAEAAYDNRSLPDGHLDPARLAVLADAVEEAGCDNQEMLAHLRGPGPHVRGCWVVDLLLGKE